jgi:hypothetical protein
VNQFPSLKTKILGPKLEQPECDVTAVAAEVTAPRSPFSPSLAAAAVAATGIAASKRKFTEDVFQPDPARLARELQRERDAANKSPKPKAPRPSPKPKTSTSSAAAALAGKSGGGDGDGGDGGDGGVGGEPREETDEEVARRLHQEFNCAPMRQSRSRRDVSNCAREVMEDANHGQDPGILPSC